MARMVPFPMLPTVSSAERRLYEGFLEQLDEQYVVYHSVDWVLASPTPGGPPIQGESDFLIAHPIDGLLVLEVKGGDLTYDPTTRRWAQTGGSGRHFLDEDPFHQARDGIGGGPRTVTGSPSRTGSTITTPIRRPGPRGSSTGTTCLDLPSASVRSWASGATPAAGSGGKAWWRSRTPWASAWRSVLL